MKKRTKMERGKPPDALQIFLHLLSFRRPERVQRQNPSSLTKPAMNPSPQETVPAHLPLSDVTALCQADPPSPEEWQHALAKLRQLERMRELVDSVLTMELLQQVREGILEVLRDRAELRRQVASLKKVLAVRDAEYLEKLSDQMKSGCHRG